MPSLFDEVPWWTTADMNNALARENRPKPRGFRLNSSDRINAEYGPLVYDDPSATAFANDQSQKLIEQRGQPGVISKLLIGGAANALDAAGIPGVFDPDGTVRGQTWGNALRASSWIPQDTVEGVGQAITAPARAYRGEIPDEDMISEGLNFAGNMAIGGSAVPKPTNAAGMFGGRLAKTADHAALKRAEELAAKGAPREDIWSQTGWFKGVDGKWRFEIDDSVMKPRKPETWARPWKTWDGEAWTLEEPSVGTAIGQGGNRLAGEQGLFDHQHLESAYPGVAGIRVRASNGSPLGTYSPAYGPKPGSIELRSTLDPNDAKTTALHEGQHAVQDVEGFGPGSSMRGWGAQAEDSYLKTSGEVEARAVQKRLNLTPEQRSSRPPWLDYDVPESQQIVRLGANTTEASAPGVVMAEAARQPKPVQMEVPFYRGSAHGQTSVDYSQPYWGVTHGIPDVAQKLASDYAKSRSGMYFNADTTPNVTPAVARFRNPLEIDAQNNGWSQIQFEGGTISTDKLADLAKERGHDGLVVNRVYDEGRFDEALGLPSTVAALRPGTVSSAFDPNNILYGNSKSAGVPGGIFREAGRGMDNLPIGTHNPLMHEDLVTLYHGTTEDGAAGIRSSGFINEPAFFSPKRDAAASYGANVIEARVPKSSLMIDFDLPGGRLLSVDEANAYAAASGKDTTGWTIDDWIRSGQSVGVDRDVKVAPSMQTRGPLSLDDILYQNAKSSGVPGAVIAGADSRPTTFSDLLRAVQLATPSEAAASIHNPFDASAFASILDRQTPAADARLMNRQEKSAQLQKSGVELPAKAAVRVRGEVFTGRNHGEAINAAVDKYGSSVWDDIDKSIAEGTIDHSGFLTSDGRYVSRQEAQGLMNKRGLLDNDRMSDPNGLDSGDILYGNAKSAAPAGVVIAGAGDQAPRVANSDDALIQILQRYGLTR